MRNNRPRVAVLGLGAWGAALALHFARRGLNVTGWNRSIGEGARVTAERGLKIGNDYHPIPDGLFLTSDLAEVDGCDFLVIALPARAWSTVVPKIQAGIFVSATKGLESTSGLTPLSYLKETVGLEEEKLAVISGPSFASDLAASRPLSIVAASKSTMVAELVADLIAGPSVRAYTSSDPLGVEIGGIFKNVVAIAAGVSDSLAFGPSARAGIISRGLAEMIRLATAMGVDSKTLTGLSGLGDLIMTATEDQSRNRMVGLRLGRGEKLEEIVKSLGSTAEGVTTAPLIQALAAKHSVEVPITDNVVRLLSGAFTPKQLATELMNRPRKSEF